MEKLHRHLVDRNLKMYVHTNLNWLGNLDEIIGRLKDNEKALQKVSVQCLSWVWCTYYVSETVRKLKPKVSIASAGFDVELSEN